MTFQKVWPPIISGAKADEIVRSILLFSTFPPAAISPLKSTPHSPSSPRPQRPQTTTPPTPTLPATPRYLPPPPPCPIFEWCFVPTVIKRLFDHYFSPVIPSAAPPAFQIHPLDRAILPSSTPAAYHRLSRSIPLLLPFRWSPTMATYSRIVVSY